MRRLINSCFLVIITFIVITGCGNQSEQSNQSNQSGTASKVYYTYDSMMDMTCIIGFENEYCNSNISEMEEELGDYYELKYFEVFGDDIIIPESIDGKDICAIDGGAFNDCFTIKSITLSDNITIIEPGTFDGCSDDLILYGSENSEAEQYANENNIEFKKTE